MRELFPWTEEADALLAHLWADGVSVLEIAKRMGTTKNSVVGRAHRRKLEPRASPIRFRAVGPSLKAKPESRIWKDETVDQKLRRLWADGYKADEIAAKLGVSESAVARRSRCIHLPPRSRSTLIGAVCVRPASKQTLCPSLPARPVPIEQAQPVLIVQVAAGRFTHARTGRVQPCAWLDGERPAWTACTAPSEPGRSYCPAHAARAYALRAGVVV